MVFTGWSAQVPKQLRRIRMDPATGDIGKWLWAHPNTIYETKTKSVLLHGGLTDTYLTNFCKYFGTQVDCDNGAAKIIAAINFVAQVVVIQDTPLRSALMEKALYPRTTQRCGYPEAKTRAKVRSEIHDHKESDHRRLRILLCGEARCGRAPGLNGKPKKRGRGGPVSHGALVLFLKVDVMITGPSVQTPGFVTPYDQDRSSRTSAQASRLSSVEELSKHCRAPPCPSSSSWTSRCRRAL